MNYCSDATSHFAPIVSAVTALVAVIISPFVALYLGRKQHNVAEKQLRAQIDIAKNELDTHSSIAKQQIAASVLSKNRQEWINKLRDYIAEYLVRAGEAVDTRPPKYGEKLAEASLILFKIELMINPKEEDHQKLIALLRKSVQIVINAKTDTKVKSVEFGNSVREVIDLTQPILKREWERVKKGE